MRRTDKEISDRSEIDKIINGCDVCHLGFAVNNEPYVVPISFGYDGTYLYLHTAKAGHKIDCIGSNPRVCFQMERNVSLVTDDAKACGWTFKFESVVGFGTVEELMTDADKSHALNQIMFHYSGKDWEVEPHELPRTRLWRVSVESVTGKRSK